MDGSEYMYTTAELGVGLAGFAALIIAIRGREGSSLSQIDRLLIASLIERSLVAAFLSLLPILLLGLKMSQSAVWFLASGTLAVYGISLVVRTVSNIRRSPSVLVSAPMYYTLIMIGLIVIVTQLMNAFALGIQQSAWWYLLGVTWLLVTAGYRFFFVLHRWIRSD